ncbi:MAG TPA: ABC transporter permease [Bryobacteraceae bacterium]|nr:ABC transporter permease [Bryobacteraceae bacterium]
MKTLLQDIRYGVRMLRKTPGLTAVVAVTLALGIAANALIFSIVNGYLLRPLSVPDAGQIAFLATQQKGSSPLLFTFSDPDFQDVRAQAAKVADVFAFIPVLPGLSADGEADQMLASYVTGNYFTALQVKPFLGRLIVPAEENQPGKEAVLVLGYSYWQKRFGGNPNVIGKQVRLNGKPAVIIGVVPKQFRGTMSLAEMDGYIPMSNGALLESAGSDLMQDRESRVLRVMARLHHGVTYPEAQSAMDVIAGRLAKEYPASDKNITMRVYREQLARPQPLGNNVVAVIAGFFLVLAGMVLLLACMNVANVLLARATVRRREMGLRAALGASRGRLIRQMLTETVLLGLLGGAAGVLLGNWFNPGDVSRLVSTSLPVHLDLSFDWRVFAYAFGAALFSGILVGLWPAWRASRADINSLLQEGGRGDTAGIGRHWMRNALVVAQVAGSLVLLVVAGLLVRSLQHAGSIHLGFDPAHVLNVNVDPHEIGYDEKQQREFYRRLEARVREIPGVESVSLAYGTPMGTITNVNAGAVTIEGHSLLAGQQPPTVFFNNVDSGYFETMRIPLLRGRSFSDSDNQTAPRVAIVNQAMAEEFWPHEDPMGKQLTLKPLAAPAQTMQVVGVAGNGKYAALFEDQTAFLYVPMAQNFVSGETLQVRSSVTPESLMAPVRNVIRGLAPDLPIIDTSTMGELVDGANGLQIFRIGAYFAAAIGGLGLFMAVLGVYGVVSFAAVQRTREIGVRMALGGTEGDVLRLVLRQGVTMVLAGLGIGVLAALALTRVMTRFLFGVSPSDPLTYVIVAAVLSAIALAACWLPARRATRVDPSIALRYE